MPDESDPVGSEEMFDGEKREDRDPTIVDVLCGWLISIIVLFAMSALFLVFGLASLVVTAPGSASNVAAAMSIVGAGAIALGSISVISVCKFTKL
ncbi:MAG: hypothetical protein ABEH66_03265 [Halobacteriales archaeon]